MHKNVFFESAAKSLKSGVLNDNFDRSVYTNDISDRSEIDEKKVALVASIQIRASHRNDPSPH